MAVVIVLFGLIAAYWVGTTTAAQAEQVQSLQSAIPVSAAVEKRSVSKELVLSGVVVAGARTAVSTIPALGVDRLVVTSAMKLTGETVVPGEILAVVSGRPLLVLPSSVPLYRDIRAGDAGPDVTALQEALGSLGYTITLSGIFDGETSRALNYWYQAAGFKAPLEIPNADSPKTDTQSAQSDKNVNSVVFRWREFVQIPGDSGRVTSIASPGTVLEPDMPVAEVSTEDDRIVARADVLQADSFAVGTAVIVRAGDNTFEAKVTALSNFREADPEKEEVPGMDVVLALSPGDTGVSPGQSVTLTTGTTEPETLAVPLIAIRQEAGDTYVEVQSPSGINRVNVTVSAQADGWAALADNPDITIGDTVLLP